MFRFFWFRQIQFRIFWRRPDAPSVLVLVVVPQLVEHVVEAVSPVVDPVHDVLLHRVQLVERNVEVKLQLANDVLQNGRNYKSKNKSKITMKFYFRYFFVCAPLSNFYLFSSMYSPFSIWCQDFSSWPLGWKYFPLTIYLPLPWLLTFKSNIYEWEQEADDWKVTDQI